MKSNQDELRIDEAIDSYPLEALPEGFVEHVLVEIEPRRVYARQTQWDPSTRFLYSAAPVAILWISLTAALLVRFSPAWIDPARASYVRSMIQYWRLQIAYSGLPLQQMGVLGIAAVVAVGFVVLWRVTDPARGMEF